MRVAKQPVHPGRCTLAYPHGLQMALVMFRPHTQVCGVACKPDRALSLARLLLDRVLPSVAAGGGPNGGGAGGSGFSEPPTRLTDAMDSLVELGVAAPPSDPAVLLCQQLASLLLLSCLDLIGHVRLAAAAVAGGGSGSPTAGAAAAGPDALLPLGGKTMELHNQLRQYAATPATALLLLAWAGCLRLMDVALVAAGASGGGGGASGAMIRDLDGAARELEARVSAAGGLEAVVASASALCGGASGALLLVYRGVATKALCALCEAFNLGVDTLEPAKYDMVVALLRICIEGAACRTDVLRLACPSRFAHRLLARVRAS